MATLQVLVFATLIALAMSAGQTNNKQKGNNRQGPPNGKGPSAQVIAKMKECNSTYPITREVIDSIHRKGNILDEKNETQACYLECMMKNALVDSSGKFSSSLAQKNIKDHAMLFGPPGTKVPSDSTISSAINECSKQRSVDGKCRNSVEAWKCLYRTLHVDD